MLNLNATQLLLFTISLAAISIYYTKKRSKTVIAASSAYWFAWIFLTFSTVIAIENKWITELSNLSFYYISQLHLGAFMGFLLGSLLSGKKKQKFNPNIFLESNNILNKLSNRMLAIFFILGSVFLIDRINRTGLSLSYFTDVRNIYLEGERGFIEWAGGHLGVMVGFIIILIGIKHAKHKIYIPELIRILIASAPLGLANGSRIFLFYYF